MVIIAWIALGLCLVLAIGQCVVVAAFIWNMLRPRPAIEPSRPQPKAAVVLALRGPDPFLDDCLQRLFAQQYPDYTIFLIVDSEQDPVMEDIDRGLNAVGSANVVVSILKKPLETCSLKCSALIQAVGALDESYEVVAFLDGDALPHSTWLLELVNPLGDSRIGVTYGNRWYVPTPHGWGAWIRYCWNVGAVVQVWLNDIIWAGSMALKTETIHNIDLLSAWSRALSVDATVHRQLRIHRYKVRFVPSVMVVNCEAISLSRFIRWVQRQLIAAKSTGAGWRLVGFHAMNLAATQLLTVVLFVAGLATAHSMLITLSGIGLAIYWGSSLLAILVTEWAVRKIVRTNGEIVRWPGWTAALRVVPGMLLTQVFYPYALLGALFRRRVDWRGIEYDVRGVGNVWMKNYHPYVERDTSANSESIV